MRILAFDTTNSSMSIAIISDNKIIATQDIFESSMQSEMLIPLIEKCLNSANIWYQDLDLLAITNGPGSFTGVRVGFSVAKAMELGTGIPLIGVSSLHAIAYDYKDAIYKGQEYNKILIVMDARLDEFFIQEFDIREGLLKPAYEPKIISCDQIIKFLPKEKFLLAGSAKLMVVDDLIKDKNFILSKEDDYIKASNIGFLAKDLYENNSKDASLDVAYVRKPRISKRKK